MIRQNAIDALTEGKKITHRYFTPNEYLEMDKVSGKIFDEDGMSWGHLSDEGMESRKSGCWKDGWGIYKEQKND